jgi:cytochrome P450
LTLEAILELVLGVRDAGLRGHLIENFDALANPRNDLALFLPEWLTRRQRWNGWVYKPLDRVNGLLREHIVATRSDASLEDRTDVLSLLIRARDENGGSALSDEDLRDELLTLVIAGHETTATGMAWACDLLAHNPHVLERLRECEDSTYLKATAKEVLRARTLLYSSAGRQMLEPFPIEEWTIEPGVLILVDAQGIHGDPELYREPAEFRPERFIDHPPDGYAYIPFGGGAHRCLGASLAMLELETFIEVVAARLELYPDGPPARLVRRGITLVPGNGGRVRVAPARVPSRAVV